MTLLSTTSEKEERLLQIGSNKFELVDFRLYDSHDSEERNYEGIYGINIAKVREINKMSTFTKLPNCHECIEGVLELREEAIPVVNLSKYLGFENYIPKPTDNIIICEFNHLVTGFIVHEATRIRRISWENILPPTRLTGREGGCVTGMHRLDENQMLLILDFEKIVAEINGDNVALEKFEEHKTSGHFTPNESEEHTVLLVDDSSTARAQVEMLLAKNGYRVLTACDGEEGLEVLQSLYEQSQAEGRPMYELIQVVISDVEMPRMDGYHFAQTIKSDMNFSFLPVIMNTSLSGRSNIQQARSLADDYIVKFNPVQLVDAVEHFRSKTLDKMKEEHRKAEDALAEKMAS